MRFSIYGHSGTRARTAISLTPPTGDGAPCHPLILSSTAHAMPIVSLWNMVHVPLLQARSGLPTSGSGMARAMACQALILRRVGRWIFTELGRVLIMIRVSR